MAALLGAAILSPVSVSSASVFLGDPVPSVGPAHMPVLDDTVVIQAPSGYCIDRLASLDGTIRAFVLLVSCQAATGQMDAPAPEMPGLLTASIDGTDAELPSQGELTRYFTSRSGKAALSQSGDPDAMTVDVVFARHGVLYLHSQEITDDPVMGSQTWRAVFSVNGRMVTATFRDLADHPVDSNDGFRTVERFVDAIVAASPDPR